MTQHLSAKIFWRWWAMNKSCCQKHQLYSFSTFLIFLSSSSLAFFACRHHFFSATRCYNGHNKVMKIDHHRGPVVNVAISSTSQVLVSGSHDATICLWSLETYELLNLMQFNSPVLNFRLSPDSVRTTFSAVSLTDWHVSNLGLSSCSLRGQWSVFTDTCNRNGAPSTERTQI